MTNENKKSTIEEAVSDLQKIREAADKNAMDKLVKAFPKKFETLLKEELEKVSNKESERKEPVKGKIEESVKDKNADKVNESVVDIREMSLGDIEGEFDGAPETAEFQVQPDENGREEVDIELTMGDIEEELAKMEGLANNMEMGEANNNAENEGDPFSKIKNIFNQLGEMVQEMEDQKMHEQYGSMFEEKMAGVYGESFRESIGEEKCNELYETFVAHQKGEPFGDNSHKAPNVNESEDQPFENDSDPSKEQGQSIAENEEVAITEAIDPMALQSIGGALGVLVASGGLAALQHYLKQKNPKVAQALEQLGSAAGSSIKGGSVPNGSIQENDELEEMHVAGSSSTTANPDSGHKTDKAGITEWNFDKKDDKESDEVEVEVGDKKIEIEDKKEDDKEGEDVDEAMGISISAGTITPGKLGDHDGTHGRFRQDESFTKKMNSLIGVNKKVTKELNENKKQVAKATTLVESYRNALEKYRNQLSEMAVFNTNLANVNNLLVNEQLALTTEDKVKIINKFKTINSITESEKGYNEVLTEMKSAKKTITENVEEKMSDSVGESASKTASKKIDEAIERTAFSTNEQVNKIKRVMEYVEKGKRI